MKRTIRTDSPTLTPETHVREYEETGATYVWDSLNDAAVLDARSAAVMALGEALMERINASAALGRLSLSASGSVVEPANKRVRMAEDRFIVAREAALAADKAEDQWRALRADSAGGRLDVVMPAMEAPALAADSAAQGAE